MALDRYSFLLVVMGSRSHCFSRLPFGVGSNMVFLSSSSAIKECTGAFVMADQLVPASCCNLCLTRKQGAGAAGQTGSGAGESAAESDEGAAAGWAAGLPGRGFSGATRP